jgi:hypothetical protein
MSKAIRLTRCASQPKARISFVRPKAAARQKLSDKEADLLREVETATGVGA